MKCYILKITSIDLYLACTSPANFAGEVRASLSEYRLVQDCSTASKLVLFNRYEEHRFEENKAG